MNVPHIDLSFSCRWQAEILPARPAILPARSFIYPQAAEEVERGALEVLVRPASAPPFLATCALGFRSPAVPSGLWSCPNAEELCAVSGGYAYLIDTSAPERFIMLPYKPVLKVLPAVAEELLLFVGHRSVLAWGAQGQVWESAKLSDEGVTITGIKNGILRGTGWEMLADKDIPFALDLRCGDKLP